MMAALSATMAGMYLAVWLRQRDSTAYLMSALLALSIVGIAVTEIGMLRALTPESYMVAIRWFQVPIWSGYVAVVWLLYLRLRPRRLWLGWLALGLRSVALVATFASAPSLNYEMLTAVEHITYHDPADGAYMVTVHGWNVPNDVARFDLDLFAIQGDGVTARGLPEDGGVAAGEELSFEVCYELPEGASGAIYYGQFLFGPQRVPRLFELPLAIIAR